MHTYKKTGVEVWTVGFQTTDGRSFEAIKDFASEADAAAYASYLNGGPKPA